MNGTRSPLVAGSRLAIAALTFGTLLPLSNWAQERLTPTTSVESTCGLPAPKSDSAQNTLAACDAQHIATLVASGRAYRQNQQGIESALVLGPGRSITDARKWFEKAARNGYAPAQMNLAILYLNGWGTQQNYGTALYWLKAAAEQHNARAYSNLGILYLKGWGVRQDYTEALRYSRLAAEAGETGAMVNLGYMYDGGLGIPLDHAVAAEWYRNAAERGDPLGQNNLADLYLRGEGVAQSDELALTWFKKAAAHGNTGARIKLGYMYANGRAIPKDPETAYTWILAASMAGDQRGQEFLRLLEPQLSAEQLAHARKRAADLQASPQLASVETAFVR